jgi:MFS family permease
LTPDRDAALDSTKTRLPGGWLGFIAIAVLVCGPAMVGMMLTIVLPILPNIAKDVEGGRDVLIAMPTMGIVVGGIAAGSLLSRFSARALMLWMVAAFGIVGFAGVLLHGVGLLASRFLIGVVATCISASSTTLIGEHIPADQRSRILGFQMAGSSLAGIAAMNISGAVSDAFGWHASFFLFPVIAILILAAGLKLLPRSASPSGRGAKLAHGARPHWKLLLDMWPLYLFLLAMHATAYTPNSQSAFVMAANGISKAGMRANIQSINQVAIVLASICYPFTRRLLGSRWIPAFFLTMMAIGLVLLGAAHSILMVCVALAFLGVGNGTLFPHQSSLILARAAPEIRGRAVGLMSSNQFLADSINPFAYRGLADAGIDLHDAIAGAGMLSGLGALAALAYGTRATNAPIPEAAKGFGH